MQLSANNLDNGEGEIPIHFTPYENGTNEKRKTNLRWQHVFLPAWLDCWVFRYWVTGKDAEDHYTM